MLLLFRVAAGLAFRIVVKKMWASLELRKETTCVPGGWTSRNWKETDVWKGELWQSWYGPLQRKSLLPPHIVGMVRSSVKLPSSVRYLLGVLAGCPILSVSNSMSIFTMAMQPTIEKWQFRQIISSVLRRKKCFLVQEFKSNNMNW